MQSHRASNGKNVCKWVPVTEEKCIPGVEFGTDNCSWVENCSDVSDEAGCTGKNTGANRCCEWQYPESKKA